MTTTINPTQVEWITVPEQDGSTTIKTASQPIFALEYDEVTGSWERVDGVSSAIPVADMRGMV